jgi:hypothetical protein
VSIKISSAVWTLDLPPLHKFVLLAFADHSEDGGTCYPSIQRIASRTGFSNRQVKRIVSSLRRSGFLQALKHSKGGRGYATFYKVVPDNSLTLHDLPSKKDVTADTLSKIKGDMGDTLSITEALKGDIHDRKGCHPEQKRVTSMTEKGDIAVSPQSSGIVIESSEKRKAASFDNEKPKTKTYPPRTWLENLIDIQKGVLKTDLRLDDFSSVQTNQVLGIIHGKTTKEMQILTNEFKYVLDQLAGNGRMPPDMTPAETLCYALRCRQELSKGRARI